MATALTVDGFMMPSLADWSFDGVGAFLAVVLLAVAFLAVVFFAVAFLMTAFGSCAEAGVSRWRAASFSSAVSAGLAAVSVGSSATAASITGAMSAGVTLTLRAVLAAAGFFSADLGADFFAADEVVLVSEGAFLVGRTGAGVDEGDVAVGAPVGGSADDGASGVGVSVV